MPQREDQTAAVTPRRRLLHGARARMTGGPAGVHGRLVSVVTATMGIVLLGAAIFGAATAGRDAAFIDLDNALSSDAVLRANALQEYFERAESIELLLAKDSALEGFEEGRELSGPEFAKASAQAAETLAYLQELYPGQISEACLIDDTGTEWARVVRGEIAPASELSTEESKAPFFAPTLALPEGHVHQAAPYISPDTDEWVISNSTPMVSASGRTWGMVHFEVILERFRPGTDGTSTQFTDLIVDNHTGRVLLDSEQALARTDALGREGSAELRAFVGGSETSATVDGHRMAVATLPVRPDNENSWSVVVVAPVKAAGWAAGVGSAVAATVLAALLLLGFAGFARRASRRAEQQGEARYRALIDQSSDLVLVTDRAGRADFLSPSVERLFTHDADDHPVDTGERKGTAPFDLVATVDPEDRARFYMVLQTAGPDEIATGEYRINSRHGTSTYEISVQDLSADPSVNGLVVTGRDVTERLKLTEELEHRSLHDTLTGLPNRALLADRFEQALRSSEREGTRVGLLLLDLDRFKEVNDTFGHHYGDELLLQIGTRLTSTLRGADTVARLGGDEFAVLLPGVGHVEDATRVAAALQSALAGQFHVAGVDLDVEASIGVAVSGEHSCDPIALMRHADIAMYVAKTQRLGVAVYDPSLDGHSATKLALVGELRRAMDCGELVLYYQPKISIDNADLVGAEALVRWRHPDRGLVLPDEFIPMAEHTGLINPLTRHVLGIALAQARTWLDDGRPLPISVNISARNLHDGCLPGTVSELLAKHDVPAHLLELELTESAIMIDPAGARLMLEQLSALGVRLSLDDFGAGYTSLSQLTSMPIDEIKIDRAFVMTMIDDPDNALIVTSVIDLGHNLGLTMVAEGVETAGALTALAGFGCDVAQGYHLSRPLPVADFDSWCTGMPITPALVKATTDLGPSVARP